MRDKLTDAIRIGIVSSIDPQKCMAKVTFEDRSGTVSRDLFVLVPFTLKDKAYFMPSIGERVRVIFDPEAPSKGYILGSYYADNRQVPVGDENKFHILFEDDACFEYDKKIHELTIKIPSSDGLSISVATKGDVSIKTDGGITVDAARDITITSKADISVKSDGNINIESKKDLYLKGQTSSMIL